VESDIWRAVDADVSIHPLCVTEGSWCFFLYFEVVETAVPDEESEDDGEESWACSYTCDDSPYSVDTGDASFVFGIDAVLLKIHLFVHAE